MKTKMPRRDRKQPDSQIQPQDGVWVIYGLIAIAAIFGGLAYALMR